jgi:hypothetical protein
LDTLLVGLLGAAVLAIMGVKTCLGIREDKIVNLEGLLILAHASLP